MNKKYRLVIPNMIPSDRLDVAYKLKHSSYVEADLEWKNGRVYSGQGYYFANQFPTEWLEEIPQKSAFQEWREKEDRKYDFGDPNRYGFSKEGWNAAIDAVLDTDFQSVKIFSETLKALKEP